MGANFDPTHFFMTFDEKDYSFENISSAMLFLACGLAAIWASIDKKNRFKVLLNEDKSLITYIM